MSHIKDYLLIILIAFVSVWIYVEATGNNKPSTFNPKDYEKVVEIIDTQYLPKYYPKYIKGDSFIFEAVDTIQVEVHDTVQVVNDYLTVKAYSDTIKQDSNIFVIEDTITQNRIKSRGFTAKITEKTIYVKEYYAEKAKYGLYLGIRGDFRQDNGLDVVSPGLMLNAKNKALIGLNVNINKNYNISYSGSVYFKIGKR